MVAFLPYWIPIAFILREVFEATHPRFPSPGVPLVQLKAHGICVAFFATLAFLTMFPRSQHPRLLRGPGP